MTDNPTDAALDDLSAHMKTERETLSKMVAALEKLNYPDPLQSEAFAAYRAAGLARADFDRLHWRARKAWVARQMGKNTESEAKP